MKRTKSTFLALVAVLLSPMAANADPISVSTGDLGNNVINDAGDYTWGPLLISPSGLGADVLTIKYGLWNSPSVLVNVWLNSTNIGNFMADQGYISPGPEYFVVDVTGLLVPVRDAQALANAIQRLIEDTDLRQCKVRKGRLLAEKEFSIERVVQAHLDIYQELLASA